MNTSKTIFLALAAALAASADAHSKMSLPKPTWDNGYGTNSPSGTIDGPTALTVPSGMSFSTDPTSNTKAYTAAIKSSKYGSLKELAFATQKTESGASKECGFSKTSGAAQPLPDVVQWDELTSSHEGPCEVWCDGTMAFHDDNCAKNYPGSPAKLPYDKSKCSGAKMLMSIWLALHTPTWQVYTNCAPIGSGGGTSAATPASAPASAPASTPAPAPAQGGTNGANSGGNTGGNSGTDEYSEGATNGNSGATTSGANSGATTGGSNNSNSNKNTGSSNSNNKKTGSNNNSGSTTTNNNNNKNTGNGWGNWGASNQPSAGNNRNSWTFGK